MHCYNRFENRMLKKDKTIPMQTMKSHSIYKVPRGKLLKISVEYDEQNNVIKDIRITGDFFVYPEEAVELMEREIHGTVIEKQQLLRKVQSIISDHHIEFIGLDAEGLVQGILMCRV